MADIAKETTCSDLSCIYQYEEKTKKYILYYYNGILSPVKNISAKNPIIDFITETKETLVILKRKNIFLDEILLNPEMNSGVCSLIINDDKVNYLFFLNSKTPSFYNKNKFEYFESSCKLINNITDEIKLKDK